MNVCRRSGYWGIGLGAARAAAAHIALHPIILTIQDNVILSNHKSGECIPGYTCI